MSLGGVQLLHTVGLRLPYAWTILGYGQLWITVQYLQHERIEDRPTAKIVMRGTLAYWPFAASFGIQLGEKGGKEKVKCELLYGV